MRIERSYRDEPTGSQGPTGSGSYESFGQAP